MNHYPRHINDFNNATRHLSRIERSIYSDMIDMYYDTEKPLSLDTGLLKRRLLARTEEEIKAVDDVLAEFFVKTAGGWFHPRCDEELTAYFENKSLKAIAGRASAKKRAENKAKRLAELNGIQANSEQDLSEVQQNLTGVEQVLNSVPTESNDTPTNQEPRTKNQEPLNTDTPPKKSVDGGDGVGQEVKTPKQTRAKAPAKTVKVTIPDDFGVNEALLDWARSKGITEPEIHIRMEHFRNLCVAQGYTYAGHAGFYAAFQNAVNGDWAKLGKPPLSPMVLGNAITARKTLRSAVSDDEIADAMAIGQSRTKKP